MIRAVIDTNGPVSGLLSQRGNEALIILAVNQVTGNKRHFPPGACGAVRVVNAAELLDRITLEI